MKPAIITLITFVLLIPIPIFAEETRFYNNEKYDLSFEMPIDWKYQEEIILEPNMYVVMSFPEKFSIENIGDNEKMVNIMQKLGLSFRIDSPLVSVDFRNISESKVSTLNEDNLQQYVVSEILSMVPDATIIDSYTKSHSWGWEIYTKYTYDLDLADFGLDSTQNTGEEVLFVFKDREAYNLSYGSPDRYYDDYKPIFDHARETLVIKSVAVPEFGSVALLILTVSIVSVVIVSRRFNSIRG